MKTVLISLAFASAALAAQPASAQVLNSFEISQLKIAEAARSAGRQSEASVHTQMATASFSKRFASTTLAASALGPELNEQPVVTFMSLWTNKDAGQATLWIRGTLEGSALGAIRACGAGDMVHKEMDLAVDLVFGCRRVEKNRLP